MCNTTVVGLTASCTREDCRVRCHGTRTTMMGIAEVYDRNGTLLSGPKRTSLYGCRTCGQSWEVVSDPGQPDVVRKMA